jgi:hypothetical protein
MYQTVIPIHNLDLELPQPVQFGHGFKLGPLPEWVLKDSMLEDLHRHVRERVADSTLAFVSTYDAIALGDPDPDWKEERPRGIQDAKYEAGVMANLALWIAKPSPAGFTVVIHAPEYASGPIAQRASTHAPLLCHPRHGPSQVTESDIDLAAQLHTGLVEIMKSGRDSSLWTVARSVWAGLQMENPPIRCTLFWVALEALFGPEDGREITYRLSQRLGFFLGHDRPEARELFVMAKRGYAFRSRIVHGNWKKDPEADDRMFEAERFVRQSLLRILRDTDLIQSFSSRARETYLDDLVFTGGAA